MIRVSQLVFLLGAAGLWIAARLTWVQISSFDGLGQPRTAALTGAGWSSALLPLALLLAAAAIALLAVRGWPLRVLAVLVAAASAGMGYLAISLWVVVDIAVRAAHLAEVPVADLTGIQRHYGGAVVTLVAAVLALFGAVLLMRAAKLADPDAARYTRRSQTVSEMPATTMSERMMWDALDEGSDPTQDPAHPDNKGR
ncbi:MAG: TIGR02234 family membrane protein [Mycolicibacterium sp.]|uniref:TIGR02234 family membrane protein n=1 Tax=Mycolicibacterium sp. TaxID=2320850 RepID=UPI003D0F1B18